MSTEAGQQPPELSQAMQALSTAIRTHAGNVSVVFCGFDLWLEVMGSGHTSTLNFRTGGVPADGTEDENTVVVPVVVIGGKIVVSFNPKLAPDAFALK